MIMRHFLLALALLVVLVLCIAGFRGSASRRPPIELFNDMVRQAKPRPQTPSDFFSDTHASRFAPTGTVARGSAFQDLPLNTGRVTGTTNFVELNPWTVTAALLARGRERYQITCLPCHGAQADGKGIITKYGMVVIANLHDPRIVRMKDGEIFHTIGYGRNLMQGYAATVDIPDRWAIVAYVRTLQLAHLGTMDDVPLDQQSQLRK